MSEQKTWLENILNNIGIRYKSWRKGQWKPDKRRLHLEPLEERQLLSMTVGVSVPGTFAKEGVPGNFGQYRISRDTVDSTPLTVSFQMEGTASYDSYSSYSRYQLYNTSGSQIYLSQNYDYTTYQYVYTGSVTIPANQTYVDIELRPVNDAIRQPDETAILKLTQSGSGCGCGCGCGSGSSVPPYEINVSAASATVTIQDNDNWTVSVVYIKR